MKLPWKCIGLLGFFIFKLFICRPNVKRPKSFRGLTPWTPTKAPLWIPCGAYSTLRTSSAFYNYSKIQSYFKKRTLVTAWIIPWSCNGLTDYPENKINSIFFRTLSKKILVIFQFPIASSSGAIDVLNYFEIDYPNYIFIRRRCVSKHCHNRN